MVPNEKIGTNGRIGTRGARGGTAAGARGGTNPRRILLAGISLGCGAPRDDGIRRERGKVKGPTFAH